MAADVAAVLAGRIRYYVDSDEHRHGTSFHDRPVRPPSELSKEDPSELVVLVASMYGEEIRRRLPELIRPQTYAVILVAPLHAAAWAVNIRSRRRAARPRPRKILIVGGYGYRNIGDEAQLDATLADLRARFPDRLLRVLTPDPEHTHRSHGGCLVGEAPRIAFYDADRSPMYWLQTRRHKAAFLARSWWLLAHAWLIKLGAPLALVKPRRVALLEEIATAELIFFSGGGYLTGSTLSRLWDGAFLMRIAYVLDTPVVLSGQTIGLWNSRFSRWLARRALDRTALIATRDGEASLTTLGELGLCGPRVMVTCDDALFDRTAAAPSAIRAAFAASGIDSDLAARPYLVFNAHDWGVTTSEDRQQLVSRLLSILDRLRDIGAPPVIGLPMVPADSEVLLEIERLRPGGWYRMLRVGDQLDLARGVIRDSHLCLSMKHHPLIFAIGERVPAISLTRGGYYAHKNVGALTLVGLGECAVNLLDDDYLPRLEAIYRRLTAERQRISEQIEDALRPLATRRSAFFDAVEEVVGGAAAG
jgi:polysaccharide pyruvyl transferase WcaK-like protein